MVYLPTTQCIRVVYHSATVADPINAVFNSSRVMRDGFRLEDANRPEFRSQTGYQAFELGFCHTQRWNDRDHIS